MPAVPQTQIVESIAIVAMAVSIVAAGLLVDPRAEAAFKAPSVSPRLSRSSLRRSRFSRSRAWRRRGHGGSDPPSGAWHFTYSLAQSAAR